MDENNINYPNNVLHNIVAKNISSKNNQKQINPQSKTQKKKDLKTSNNEQILPNELMGSKSTNNNSLSFTSIDSKNLNFSSNSSNNNKILLYCPDETFLLKKSKLGFEFKFQSNNERLLFADEYLEEIYINLLEDEQNILPKPIIGYMISQKDINEQMRAILIDWLIEVHYRFKLKEETLYQTVWIIDTYLSKSPIARAKLQLLGVASLLISCKLHEIYYPQIKEFIDITDNAYIKKELLEMEELVLKVLNCSLLGPTSNDFFNIIAKAFNFDSKQYFLGKYFLESSLIDYQMIKYPPSVLAVACSYVVMKFFGIGNYKMLYSNVIIKADCPEKVIKEAARDVCFLVKNLSVSNLKAVKEKYSLPQFNSVVQFAEEK